MNITALKSPLRLRVVAALGILFGLLTIRAGGAVLFGADAAREAAGDFVPFVVWFNFLAGFVYVVAGAGLWMQQQWAVRTALGIAAATLVVFAAFGVHIAAGGAFEARTVIAMTLRSVAWLLITAVAWRALP